MIACDELIAPMISMGATIVVLTMSCATLVVYAFNAHHDRNETVTKGDDQEE